ncbi:MAG: hypothetical protein M3249_01085, partial [Thermoproteota archaeon]|nr:hypothetical protein [Thermoproteota archaeon]
MTSKPVIAILAVILFISSSGTIGSFYFVSSQGQTTTTTEPAEIVLSGDEEASPGSVIGIEGTNFGANSRVSIYFMSAEPVDLDDGSAFILQGVDLNQNTTAGLEGNNTFFDSTGDTVNTLGNLLELSTGQGGNDTTDTPITANVSSTTNRNLVVVLEDAPPVNGTMSLECGEATIAQGSINTAIGAFGVSPGTYNDCLISITDGDITNAGEIDELTIASDSGEDLENSLLTSQTASEEGAFESSITVPNVEEGEYAILAVAEDGSTSISGLSVTVPESAINESAVNASSTNATEGIVNETITSTSEGDEEEVEEDENATTTTTTTTATTPVQNQTQDNQTDTSEEGGQPTVQLDETSAEPGSPLAIRGEGFQPDTPIQILINNVQITNVVASVEGSFNTVVVVPTTVVAGSAQVIVRSEQTNIIEPVSIIQLEESTSGPSTLSLTAVSTTDNGEALRNAPVTIFDARSGEVIERSRTPVDVELQEGTYSIFYSDFGRFEFESAEPGTWIDTPDGGSGLITIREGRNSTVTALYSERPTPPSPPPRVTDNSLTLRAQDTQGNLIPSMFATVYDIQAAEKIDQGFTELRVDDLPPGTYPIYFANFKDLEFLSASPSTWTQTPYGGVGLVSIPDDGEDHDIVVTAEYNRSTVVQEQFNIQAPLDVEGDIFAITSNQTRPEGPYMMSGSFALRVNDEEPVSATLSAYFMSTREDSNENVDLQLQRSRDHDTFQIVDLKPRVARPIGPNSYVVSGTADLLLNGDMYSNDERVNVIVMGGDELTPTNIEIDFRGDQRPSAANRLDTLYGVV